MPKISTNIPASRQISADHPSIIWIEVSKAFKRSMNILLIALSTTALGVVITVISYRELFTEFSPSISLTVIAILVTILGWTIALSGLPAKNWGSE